MARLIDARERDDVIYYCSSCGDEVDLHSMDEDQFGVWLSFGLCTVCQPDWEEYNEEES